MQLRQAVKVPKKNLLPPFTDSRWRLHSNLTILEPYKAVLNITGPWHSSVISFSVKPNTPYNLSIPSIRVNGSTYAILQNSQAIGSMLNNASNFTFTPTSNLVSLVIENSGTLTTGSLTFENLMLVEGSTPQPFEPYQEINRRASRLKEWEYVRLDGSLDWVFALENENSIYVNVPSGVFLSNRPQFINHSEIVFNNNGEKLTSVTSFNMNNPNTTWQHNTVAIGIVLRKADVIGYDLKSQVGIKKYFNANPYQMVYKLATPQHTPNWTEYPSVFKQYEPKPRASLKVPKKNLFDGNAPRASGFGTSFFVDNVLTITGTWYTAFAIKVNPQTNYYLSGISSGTVNSNVNVWGDSGGSLVIKNGALNSSFNSGQYSTIFIAFYSGTSTSGTSTFKNSMLIEGTQTQPYEPYQEINHPTRPRWQPVYQLPFTFERLSTAIRPDGLNVAMNQPRVEGKGIKVEEGTENLWALGGRPTNFNVGRDWHNFPSVSSGIHTTRLFARSILGATMRLTQSGGARNHYLTLSKEWQLVEWTNDYTASYLLHDTSQLGDIEIRDMQIAQKPYPTSFTDRTRSAESLILPNAIPAESGTIEFDVDFVVRNPVASGGNYQPLYQSPGGGTRFLVRYTDNNKLGVMVSHDLALSTTNPLQWQNKRYSFRIQYTKKHVKVWRDNVLVIDSAISPSTFTQSTMHVGCDNNKQRQTDLTFYNLVITDDVTGVSKKWI